MTAADNLVLVAINGSVADARAIDLAIVLAKRYHAEVTTIHVVEVPQELPLEAEMPAEVARGQAVLTAAEEVAQQYGRDLEVDSYRPARRGPRWWTRRSNAGPVSLCLARCCARGWVNARSAA